MALRTIDPIQNEGDDTEAGIMAEINITPLTDIFLVLLIIFMVTSSVMSQMGVNVHLPKASHAVTETQEQGVIVTLLSGGKLSVNQQMIGSDLHQLQSTIQAAFSKTRSRVVILEGDRAALLGSAIEVMDYARRAGAEKFAIATQPTQ